MALDPTAGGRPSEAHVSLFEAGQIAHGQGGALLPDAKFQLPDRTVIQKATMTPLRSNRSASASQAAYTPHTPVQSNTTVDPNQWDSMLNRLGQKYNVPPTFLKAVMLSESGGRPDAIGDQGHSVGLFQLNDRGYGVGMGDARFDPEINADRAAQGLAEAWHAGEKAGFTGEYAVRAAYDYSFNPGGGWAYQGDAVVANYNRLLAAQGQPPLA